MTTITDPTTIAGYRYHTHPRQTGTLVVVFDGIEQGIESDPDEPRWYSSCEEHDTICGHDTLRLAISHASDPAGWCESCRADVEHRLAQAGFRAMRQRDAERRSRVCGGRFTVAPGITLVCDKTYDPNDSATTHGAYHHDGSHDGATWTGGDDSGSSMLGNPGNNVWALLG